MNPPKPLSSQEIANMSEQDWQAKLTADEYLVLRQKATERAFTGIYTDTEDTGTYFCKGCHAPLFSSEHKYHSGCGWPSFDRTITPTALDEHFDDSYGMRRTEVTCHNCGGHLGHVFTDGPRETTGMRYCINSIAIVLERDL